MMDIYSPPASKLDFPGDSVVKTLFANAGEVSSVPELGTSPGEGNGNPLLYSCLGNPLYRAGRLQSVLSHRVGNDLVTELSCSVAKSCPTLCGPWPAACQASLSFTVSLRLPRLMSMSRWCHPTISSSVAPFSLAFNLSQHQGLFQWVSSSHQVAKVL